MMNSLLLNVEQAVLGAILRDERVFKQVLGVINVNHFADPTNKEIFRMMDLMTREGYFIDPVTLYAYWHFFPNDLICPEVYLYELANNVPNTMHALSYARLMKELPHKLTGKK